MTRTPNLTARSVFSVLSFFSAFSFPLFLGWPASTSSIGQEKILFLQPANLGCLRSAFSEAPAFACSSIMKQRFSGHHILARTPAQNEQKSQLEQVEQDLLQLRKKGCCEVNDMTVVQPRTNLRELGLKVDGCKSELQDCLGEALTVIPPTSPEQQAVVDAIRNGHCVAVTAVAGAGKTTCMLQAATQLTAKKFLIVTYSHTLKESCKQQIKRLGLQNRVQVYTLHALVGRCAGRLCKDDHDLQNITKDWDINPLTNIPDFDVLLVDEVQDLRPSFYGAISHILRTSSISNALQMALFGDPKQLLFTFYIGDAATAKYLLDPEPAWGKYTKHLSWQKKTLSTSYRFGSKIAQFVNSFCGTDITGNKAAAEDARVLYLRRQPFLARNGTRETDKIPREFIPGLIDEFGAENVMLLASSVESKDKAKKTPIQTVVNEMLTFVDNDGKRKYNFHVQGHGREGKEDLANKVQVKTFCSAKGCEADVVVVFGFDSWNSRRITNLQQIVVALTRAKKLLVVIQSPQSPAYPIRGAEDAAKFDQPHIELGGKSREVPESINGRSALSCEVLVDLARNGVVEPGSCCQTWGSSKSPRVQLKLLHERCPGIEGPQNVNFLPGSGELSAPDARGKKFYSATEFTHLSAKAEKRFLGYGKWSVESSKIGAIAYSPTVQFEETREDVSAVYGLATTLMLQWEQDGYCPQVEALVENKKILRIHPHKTYSIDRILKLMQDHNGKLEWTNRDLQLLEKSTPAKGTDMIELFNEHIELKQKRRLADGRQVALRVKALAEGKETDELLMQYLPGIIAAYNLPVKSGADWCYIANAVMAFDSFHLKFKQIGTDRASYRTWVNEAALSQGVARLQKLMTEARGSFEQPLRHRFNFEEEKILLASDSNCEILGVAGEVDWIGNGLFSRGQTGKPVQLLEIKFVSELTTAHRLQTLLYCAIHATTENSGCAGLLYNARTGEAEVCEVDVRNATQLLKDISEFKAAAP